METIKNNVISMLINEKENITEDINAVASYIDTAHTEKEDIKLSQADINYINNKRLLMIQLYDFISYIENYK